MSDKPKKRITGESVEERTGIVVRDQDMRDATQLWEQRNQTSDIVNISRIAVLISDARQEEWAQAHREGWDAAIRDAVAAIIAACGPCDGRGGNIVTVGHQPSGPGDSGCHEEEERCEYCGRPTDVLRALPYPGIAKAEE